MSVKSIKHTNETRSRIPSREEAGMEESSPVAREKVAQYPLNPVIHRGDDPELFWKDKYKESEGGDENREPTTDRLTVDIRSLYRHEHIAPEKLMDSLYRLVEEESAQTDMFSLNELFGNTLEADELEKVSEYYTHQDGWTNRLIQGDSLLVMTSLLEREGMAGKVQTIYIDPPYGIKYGSNWQMHLHNRNVTDGKDEHLSGEPEVIKAYRDTWELGIHSYLSYMRDRLLIARELLTESGSCFVQISDENVHLVRCLMDEVFGSENFVSQIPYSTTGGFSSRFLSRVGDYLLWYGKNIELLKYRSLFVPKLSPIESEGSKYDQIELVDGSRRKLSAQEKEMVVALPEGAKLFRYDNLQSQGSARSQTPVTFMDKVFYPNRGSHWKAQWPEGMEMLIQKNRVAETGSTLSYVRYFDDFPLTPINNIWNDVGGSVQSRSDSKRYVVQTGVGLIQRCLLMTTDPGDLVLDPTCGSGTTAYVAEQWGRRWITVDSSRIALNIAKTRLMTATFPYYKLHDEEGEDVRQGFKYKTVPHITLKSIANNEPADEEILYDQPEEDKGKLRVAGPFTVETLQNFEPVSPDEIDRRKGDDQDLERFEERIFDHLRSTGVRNGAKNEQALFTRVDRLIDPYLNAEGFYRGDGGEKKAYFHIGPRFGTVAKASVNNAIKECRRRGDADWLVILGFSFESNIENQSVTQQVGSFEVTKTRMHDDLMQDGLMKKPKGVGSFVTIGEPDITLHRDGEALTVEILGLDIYDPIKDLVKPRSAADISYWMLDTNYDGANFIPRQVFFCGGEKKEFTKWKKGLDDLAGRKAKRAAEKTLRVEIDEDAFDRLYGFRSHPFSAKEGGRIAVRVISQFGEESTKVMGV
ncbi:MAG: site-specific DNA-methyltransferase [Candidatus Kapaibacterium sp.]